MHFRVLTLFLVFTLSSILAANYQHSVKFKGGLIFNKEGSAQINQDHIQYTRQVDTSALFDVAQRLLDSTALYRSYCNAATNFKLDITQSKSNSKPAPKIEPSNITTISYVVTPLQHVLKEAAGVCTRIGARRVEIRDINTYDKVRTFANQNNIKYIPAGIDYHKPNNLFQFASDHTNARTKTPFPQIYYGGVYKETHPANWESDTWLTSLATDYPLIYKHPRGNFVLRLADDFERNIKEFIMCEQINLPTPEPYSPESNILVQLAIHNCKRDMQSLEAMTDFTIKELESITSLKFQYSKEQPEWHQFFPQFDTAPDIPHTRTKRETEVIFNSRQHLECALKTYHRIWDKLQAAYISLFASDIDLIQPSTHILQYENYIIQAPNKLQTLPDFILALHSFWAIQREKNFHKIPFPAWLEQQAYRQPIYAQFRRPLTLIRSTRAHTLIPLTDNSTLEYSSLQAFLSDLQNLSPNISFERVRVSDSITNPTIFHFNVTSNSRKKRATQLSFGLFNFAKSDDGSYQSASSDLPDAQTIELLKKHAIALQTITINQEQISSVVNKVVDKLSVFENQIIGRFDGMMAITLELDLKMLIRMLQTLAQTTCLKYNAAFTAATFGRTSPYVLPQRDLNEVADNLFKHQGYIVTTNSQLIKTYHQIEDNKIHFIFDIPIIDPNKEFTLYTVSVLPSFLNNTTYLPSLDSNHMAINQHGDKYTILTEMELIKCLDIPPRCTSFRPIAPTNDHTSCLVSSYVRDKLACPLIPSSQQPQPTFLFFDVNMFFSLPSPASIYIKCFPSPMSTKYKDNTIKLEGMGQTILEPTCTITLPDGTTHTTPTRPANFSETSPKLFSELRYIPQPTDYVIHQPKLLKDSPIPKVYLSHVDAPSWTDLMHETYHPSHAIIPVTTSVITIFAFLLTTFVICCCCCPNATKYWLSLICCYPYRKCTGQNFHDPPQQRQQQQQQQQTQTNQNNSRPSRHDSLSSNNLFPYTNTAEDIDVSNHNILHQWRNRIFPRQQNTYDLGTQETNRANAYPPSAPGALIC